MLWGSFKVWVDLVPSTVNDFSCFCRSKFLQLDESAGFTLEISQVLGVSSKN